MSFFAWRILLSVLAVRLAVFVVHSREDNGNYHEQKACQTPTGKFFIQKTKSEKVGEHHTTQHQKQCVGGNMPHRD